MSDCRNVADGRAAVNEFRADRGYRNFALDKLNAFFRRDNIVAIRYVVALRTDYLYAVRVCAHACDIRFEARKIVFKSAYDKLIAADEVKDVFVRVGAVHDGFVED